MNVLLSIKPKYAQLWNECKDFSGIDEEDFFDYFRGKDKGFAIEIGDVEAFDPINPKDHILNFVPPQSFCYTDKHWAGNLLTSGGGRQ